MARSSVKRKSLSPSQQAAAVNKAIEKTLQSIERQKAPRAIKMIMITGNSLAAIKTPVDTSTLINSIITKVTTTSSGSRGTTSYLAAYAAPVHDPDVKQVFRKPGAEKEFLKKGFEESRPDFDDIIRKEMAL